MPGAEARAAARLRRWVPRWWQGEGGALGAALRVLLRPAERLFGVGVRARNLVYDAGWLPVATAGIPTISVGNLTVGGAGKTPVAAWIAARLAEWGERPAIVLRGYGADEVLVHRTLNPTVPVLSARRRADGVARAAAGGATVTVLDDAFQHRSLARSLDLVLVPAESWDPHPDLLPLGPWRERPAALRRAGFAIVTRKVATASVATLVARQLSAWVPADRVAVCALLPDRLTPLHDPADSLPLGWLEGREVVAVSSLANPRGFVEQLRDLGARVARLDFPDHHAFTASDARSLLASAGGRPLVMTRKEAVKLSALLPKDAHAVVLEQRVEVESGLDELDGALRRAVSR